MPKLIKLHNHKAIYKVGDIYMVQDKLTHTTFIDTLEECEAILTN